MFSKSIWTVYKKRIKQELNDRVWRRYIINKEYTIMFLLLFALTIGLIIYKASKTILVS